MSKYTTEVRFICESYCGDSESSGYNDVDRVIAESRAKIFNFNYPIHDEEYRSVLETKILKHFYTREIGAETVGLWRMWLNTRMNEIMPYYKKLYESTMFEFNPLFDTDITTNREIQNIGSKDDTENKNSSTTLTGNKTGTSTKMGEGSNETGSTDKSTTEANEDTDSWKYYSDTPQGGINGLASLNYLTNATHDTVSQEGNIETNTTGTTTGSYSDTSSETNTEQKTDTTTGIETGTLNSQFTNTEEYIEHITGKRGSDSYSKLINEFRDTIINIDMKIINDLNDLFLNLW